MCIRDSGGVDKVAGKAQSLGGADSYNVTEGDGAFNLGVTADVYKRQSYGIPCENCGRMIRTGRFCDECKTKLTNTRCV